MSPLIPLGLAFAALSLWLSARLVQENRARIAARAGYFAALKPLFDGGETRLQPTGFPRMTGKRCGLAYDLQAIPDTLTFRKLPALWVLVTLPEPMPLQATLNLMARPSGNEPFSRFPTLPHALPTPPHQPALIFREAEMGRTPLSPARLEPILGRLATLRNDIMRGQT